MAYIPPLGYKVSLNWSSGLYTPPSGSQVLLEMAGVGSNLYIRPLGISSQEVSSFSSISNVTNSLLQQNFMIMLY